MVIKKKKDKTRRKKKTLEEANVEVRVGFLNNIYHHIGDKHLDGSSIFRSTEWKKQTAICLHQISNQFEWLFELSTINSPQT